jgi:ABC-type multidrug transport system fused ATPase/permease subunit
MEWVRPALLRQPGTPDARSPGRFLLWLAGRQRRNLVLGGVYGTVWMGTQAAIPLVVGAAIEAIIHADRGAIVGWSLAVLGLGVVQAASGALRHREAVTNRLLASSCVQRLVARQAAALGGDLSRHMAAGEVAGIGSSDVSNIANVLDILPRLIGAVVAVVGVAVVLLLESLPLGLIVAIGVPLAALGLGPLLRPLERRKQAQRDEIGAASSITADTVVGLRVLRGLGGERVFSRRFASASQRIRQAAVRTARVEATVAALQLFLPGILLVATTGVGARLVLTGEITPGTLVTAYGEAAFLLIPMETLIDFAYYLTGGLVASSRVVRLLALRRDLHFPQARSGGAPSSGRLVDRTSGLEVEPGQMVAVVSRDQRAATELGERLGRYLESQPSDAVTVAGLPLSELPLGELRRRILVLPKEAVLLAGPLSDFLLPGSGEEGPVSLAEALDAAGAAEIVDGLPDGVDTELPERGSTLSGGQRQRLLLTAALRADPEVLILDEPTSAVDAHTEAAIAARLKRLRQGRVTVILTSSPLLLEQADRVFLLDGTVIATGRHHDLLQGNEAYRELVARGVDRPRTAVAGE